MTTAYWAYGTLLQREDPSNPGTYQTVTGCRDIEGPAEERELIDIFNHSSPSGREEFIAGRKNTGTVSTRLIYNPGDTIHQGVRADYEGGTTRNWRLVLTDASNAVIAFAAFVQKFGFMEPVNNVLEINFALKVTGDISITY